MCENISANGLTLKCLPSQAESLVERQLADLPTADALIPVIDKYLKTASFFVAYMDYRVIIGKYAGKKFEFSQQESGEQITPKYLQKLRIFNKDEELLLWRSRQILKGRFRKDGEGNDVNVIDAEQVLFGTGAKPSETGEYTEITEERGTRIVLPFQNLQVNDKQKRIFLKTRNYIDYNAVHQATYVDCRFVGFTDNNGDLS